MSLVETATSVIVGFLLALLAQVAVFPVFGLVVSPADNLLIGIIFTAVLIVRSFTLRRAGYSRQPECAGPRRRFLRRPKSGTPA
jgi:hypothetical protein